MGHDYYYVVYVVYVVKPHDWPVLIHTEQPAFTHFRANWQLPLVGHLDEYPVEDIGRPGDIGKRLCVTRRPMKGVRGYGKTVCKCGNYKIAWKQKRVQKNPFAGGSGMKHM